MPSDASNPGSDRSADLKLVDRASGSESTASPADSPVDSGSSRRRGLPIWLFVVVLIACVLVVSWQGRVARELEAEVAQIQAELSRSTALLEAHRSRLDEVRSGIHDLSDQLAGLRDLADRDLADPTSAARAAAPARDVPEAAGAGATPDDASDASEVPWSDF